MDKKELTKEVAAAMDNGTLFGSAVATLIVEALLWHLAEGFLGFSFVMQNVLIVITPVGMLAGMN